ncbi:tripartite motif-containing protein 14-like [Pseudophryne corroboree]|uniref:tripartite motif-containing protein 14-like n=1 Tax=Pseudophryne corroboree TaxID=495146 RepID=UPI003081B110
MASADPEEKLSCSNCQNTDPGSLKCEHNFCWVCIDCVLDTQKGTGANNRHECRAEFQEHSVLEKKISVQNRAVCFHSYSSGKNDTGIVCTYCVDSPVPAVKSCVMCEASLCDTHVRVHSKAAEHVLIEPTTSLQNRKCSVHKKILEYYCTKDNTCICVSCLLFGDHRGHQVEMFDTVSERKREKLKNVLRKITLKTDEAENRVKSMQERSREVGEKTAGVTERVTALFRDIRRQLDDLEKKVHSEISRQEEQVSLSISKLIQQLEMRKDELSRKMNYIEDLCNLTDPLTIIQESGKHAYFHTEERENEDIEKEDKQVYSVDCLDEGLISVTLHTGLSDIATSIKRWINVKGATDMLLDIKTAGNDVHISGDLKSACWSQMDQNHPETPGRFQYDQVLSTRSFSSGRHYWEVETSESGVWFVGMCYPSINRKGRQSWIGDNNSSWCLRRYDNIQYSVIHDSKWFQLPHKVSCQVLGVYLDYEAGQLSFYELCDPIKHLHTFTTTFTEPLYAAFSVYKAWVRIKS